MALPASPVLDKYRVVSQLRRGRRGVLIHGWNEILDAEVELAILDELGADPASRDRIVRDAERLRRMRDPVLTDVREVGLLPDGEPCVVLEPVSGRSLAGLLTERGSLPWAEAARVGEIVATALSAKHAVGIHHGDLAPEDVVIGQTGVRLVAFGIGRSVDLAPAATDIAALGAILVETLSGKRLDRHDPGPVRATAPEGLPPIPNALVDLVSEMVASREHDHPAASTMADTLGAIARAGRKATLKSRD